MTTPRTEFEPYDIERGAHGCRIMRQIQVENGNELFIALDQIAKRLSLAMRLQTTSDNAIEWGRALILAAASVGQLAKNDDMAMSIVNVLAFAGVDLLDGES